MIMETPFFPEPTVAAKVIHNVASPAVSIEQERSDSTRSAVLLSQMSKPQVAVAVAESTDPFRPLFEKAVLAKAHASDEAAIIQDTAKYATKASGKADADVDWRKRSDESPQTVMTMDALFEKFSPAVCQPILDIYLTRLLITLDRTDRSEVARGYQGDSRVGRAQTDQFVAPPSSPQYQCHQQGQIGQARRRGERCQSYGQGQSGHWHAWELSEHACQGRSKDCKAHACQQSQERRGRQGQRRLA
jgi:hypothetical protein